MVIQRSSQHGHEGGEQVEAALPRLDALVLQLLVEDLDDGGDLGVQESERTVGGGGGGGESGGGRGVRERVRAAVASVSPPIRELHRFLRGPALG